MTPKHKLLLSLLAYPLFVPILSLFVSASRVQAKELVFEAPTQACQSNSRMGNLTCIREAHKNNYRPFADGVPSDEQEPMLGFSEAESKAAVALFGCDCIACMNAIRQMQGLPPIT